MQRSVQAKKRNPKKLLPLAVVVVLLAVLGGGAIAYHYHRVAQQKAAQKVITPQPVTAKGTGTTTPPKAGSTPSSPTPSTPSTQQKTPATTAPADSGQPPTAPSGTFVSNHKPGQNNSPVTEASVCQTTPGASCYISFTQGSITKKLSAKTTDSAGAAYWQSWTPDSIGLTKGNWVVTAVASSGQQSVSTTDPTPLEISQ